MTRPVDIIAASLAGTAPIVAISPLAQATGLEPNYLIALIGGAILTGFYQIKTGRPVMDAAFNCFFGGWIAYVAGGSLGQWAAMRMDLDIKLTATAFVGIVAFISPFILDPMIRMIVRKANDAAEPPP